jgi:putative phosphoribosyl transferase
MEQEPRFQDRADAGRILAEALSPYNSAGTVVLAVPRGGVPVAVEVANVFNAPLDLVVVRKIPVPGNPEAGYGAVAEDGTIFLNEPLVNHLGLGRHQIDVQAAEVLTEIERRSALYRGELPRIPLAGRTAIIIDDGLASGFTMVAAAKSVERQQAARIVVASPVASSSAYQLLKPVCDAIVCLVIRHSYPFAVASFYRHWHDLTDDEVSEHLQAWQAQRSEAGRLQ